MVWPAVFERLIAGPGWRITYLGYAGAVLLGILPLAVLLRPAPGAVGSGTSGRRRGCRGRACFGLGAATAAATLSVLLGCAFVARQFRGAIADRYGGLMAVLAGSACRAAAVGAFLLIQDEAGLFVVAAAYGVGFSGIIPAYAMTIRDLFPPAETSWRVPLVLFTGMSRMAFGGWFAGCIQDHFGFYAPAFGAGVVFNAANLLLVGFLVLRQSGRGRATAQLLPGCGSRGARGFRADRRCGRSPP